jgi:putative transposase
MAFKLIQAAQDRWRAVNAPHLVALVRAGARFERGILVERDSQPDDPAPHMPGTTADQAA